MTVIVMGFIQVDQGTHRKTLRRARLLGEGRKLIAGQLGTLAVCLHNSGAPSIKWFRLYSFVLHDPKTQRLSPALFKRWINLLCLASESEPRGALPSVLDIAFALRVKPCGAERVLAQLRQARLVDRTPEGRDFFHNRTQRQLKSEGWRDDHRLPLSEWRSARVAVFARDNYTCQYCGARGVNLQCDHIIPANGGGSHSVDNLATACRRRNQSKDNRTPEEWQA
jgi:5-methylcytosine-specific restriction endonuclease McrA